MFNRNCHNNCRCCCINVDPSPMPLEPVVPANVGALSAGTAESEAVPPAEYIEVKTLFYTLGNNIFFVPGVIPITLNAGTYLINFGASATPEANGIVGLAIAVDQYVNTSSAAFATAVAGVTQKLDSSAIILAAEGTTIALANVGNTATNYENLIININKVF